MLIQIILLAILILINALFAASEIAFLSINKNKVESKVKEGNKKAIKIKKLLDNPSSFLATIQIGITLAGFLASAFAAEAFADEIVSKMTSINIPAYILETVIIIIVTLILSYFTLVLGELVPKRIAMIMPDKIAYSMAGTITTLSKATYPFVWLLTKSTNVVCRLFKLKENSEEKLTEEDIKLMIAEGMNSGAIEKGEKELIDNIFEFNDVTISEIMTERKDVVAIDINNDITDIIKKIRKYKYTRMPVYFNDLDNVMGILNIKDILVMYSGKKDAKLDIREIIREPYFVNDIDKVDDVFKDMQEKRIAIGMVMNKDDMVGIVTIEDMVEELVGNIFDEYDIKGGDNCER